ncbi:MAG TPA: hypothetical protein VG074_10965 [Acidimicrobiales bacterium]|nr:hypothetical protein [Acidimicrobiales bacterium]
MTGVSAIVVVVVGGTVVGGLVVVVGGAVGGTVVVARVAGVRATVVDVVDVEGDLELECVTTRAITMAATAMMIATTMMVRLLTGAGFFPSGDLEDEPGCPGGGGGDPLSYVTGENVARAARSGPLFPEPGGRRSDPTWPTPMLGQRVAYRLRACSNSAFDIFDLPETPRRRASS